MMAQAGVLDDWTKEIFAATLTRMPESIRHDLVARDVAAGAPAKEMLVATIASALDSEAEAED